eukprot:scaffold100305_cov32-Tisochrysis_lutea.AAC.1
MASYGKWWACLASCATPRKHRDLPRPRAFADGASSLGAQRAQRAQGQGLTVAWSVWSAPSPWALACLHSVL